MNKAAYVLVAFLLLLTPSFASNSTYTWNSNTTYLGGKTYQVAIGGSYAYYNGTWMSGDAAPSLKNSSVSCNVVSDANDTANCLDWNYTSLTVNLSQKVAPNAVSIPVKVWIPNYTKSADYKSGTLLSSQNVSVSKLTSKSLVIPFAIGDVLEYGVNSTTITLNESNGGNVGDAYTDSYNSNNNYGSANPMYIGNAYGTYYHIYVKYNLSSIPAGSTITNVNFSIYSAFSSTWGSWTILAYNTTSTWVESGIKWNNQPAAGTLQSTFYNPSTSAKIWYFNVTNAAISSYNTDSKNMSIVLINDSSTSKYNTGVSPKEDGTAANRPQLVVTYTAGASGSTYYPNATDAITYADETSNYKTAQPKDIDSLAYSDEASLYKTAYANPVDAPTYTDKLSEYKTAVISLVNGGTWSDALSTVRTYVRSITEALTYTDTDLISKIAGATIYTVNAIDSYVYKDAMSLYKTAYSALSDASIFKDTIGNYKTYIRSITEALTYTDTSLASKITGTITYTINAIDSYVYADAVSLYKTAKAYAVDAPKLTETLSVYKTALASVTDAPIFTDTLKNYKTAIANYADSLTYKDAVKNYATFSRSITEALTYSDETLANKILAYMTYVLSVVDSPLYKDLISGSTVITNPIGPLNLTTTQTCAMLMQIGDSRAYLCVLNDGAYKVLIRGI